MSNNAILQLGNRSKRGVSVFDVEINQDWCQQLVDMGFLRPVVEQSLLLTKNTSLQAAMDWCLANPEGVKNQNEEEVLNTREMEVEKPISQVVQPPKVISRKSKDEEEREKHLEKVKKMELEKLKEAKRLQQIEKERVRQQLEEDRQNRKQKSHPVASSTPAPVSIPTPSSSGNVTQVSDCVLQIRLPGGQTVKATFKSNDKLLTVHKFIHDNYTHDSSFNLMTTFPRKEYKDKMLQATLQEAELVPMGTLTVQMVAEKGVIIKYEEPIDESELEVDDMSYEQLLDLGERIGKVTPEKKTKQERLPTRTYHASEPQEQQVCLICQCEFEDGDTLRKLICVHEFHKDCVDQWLGSHNKCPVCKADV